MDKEQTKQFLLYLDSLLKKNEIQVLPDTAKNIKKWFYKFFKQPIFNELPTREELDECLKEYTELYTPIKEVIQKFNSVRARDRNEKATQKDTLEIMKPMVESLDSAIEYINSEIGKLQEDKQITIAEKSMYIAQASDKKAKRANRIAISAIVIAVIVPVVLFIISFCLN